MSDVAVQSPPQPARAAAAESVGLLLPTLTLWQREFVRFLRQRSRIVGALVSPIVFWALIGMGLGRSFSPEGSTQRISYLEYFFPGTLVLIVLFTAIFSTISIIEDRREGFLQSVLVSPASRTSIALGKILGGASLAWMQGMLFCLLAPLSGIHLGAGAIAGLVVITFLVAFGVTGMGFLIAWPMDSSQGFHAIMNVFLIPLWLLSGALFPASGAPRWLQWVMWCNPLTYCVEAVRSMFYPNVAAVTGGGHPSLLLSLAVVIAFGAATFAASVALANRRREGV
jgi:ABC-2 type transport system permease protein